MKQKFNKQTLLSRLQFIRSWLFIAALLFAPCHGFSTEEVAIAVQSTRIIYYITPDYAEVWENGERVEVIKHYRVNGQKVATRDKEGLKFHVSDHLGSATVVVDVEGNKIKDLRYTPFGSDALADGAAVVRYKYNGKEHDDTGFYYYVARYHDPEVGRFMSADTLLPQIYDSQQLNRFTYVRNNPVKLIDPDGHLAKFFAQQGLSLIGRILSNPQQFLRELARFYGFRPGYSGPSYEAYLKSAGISVPAGSVVTSAGGDSGGSGGNPDWNSSDSDDENYERAHEYTLNQEYEILLKQAYRGKKGYAYFKKHIEWIVKNSPKIQRDSEPETQIMAKASPEKIFSDANSSELYRAAMPEMTLVSDINEMDFESARNDGGIKYYFLIDKTTPNRSVGGFFFPVYGGPVKYLNFEIEKVSKNFTEVRIQTYDIVD